MAGKSSKNAAAERKHARELSQVANNAGKQGAANPKLLSGGNPQIAKADGDAPVQAYIAAMPGWKRDVGSRLDALVVRTVPDVRKAVRWNSPFYGVEGQGWFLSYHCFTKYVKVTFLNGAALSPLPPVESKHEDVRYFRIHEDDQLDEELVASWIRQASEPPGEELF
ncbi:MAG: histidine kinase [Dehalococcoidia bacterium]|nr:histidine kinase [Dehalococcoidia bacterium]